MPEPSLANGDPEARGIADGARSGRSKDPRLGRGERVAEVSRAVVRRAAWGLLLGVWIGLVDGGWSLLPGNGPEDRLLSMAVAIGLHVALFTSLAIVFGGVLALVRRAPPTEARIQARVRRARRLALRGAIAGGIAAVALAVLGAGTVRPGSSSAPEDSRPNLILISVDTLRADHLGAYGYDRDTSPHLDALVRQGILFEHAYSSASWTLPAHATLLTGLDPMVHGALTERSGLPREIDTLADQLRAAGYRTEAWVGTSPYGYVGAAYGLSSGFDDYRHYPHPKRHRASLIARAVDGTILAWLGHDMANGHDEVDSVIDWLCGADRRPFFVFIHFYDVHSKTFRLPYEAPGPFRDRFCPGAPDGFGGCRGGLCASELLHAMASGQEPPFDAAELDVVRCLYDGAIAFVDDEVGRLLAFVDESGLGVRTVVVVTADHGEAFFEHGVPLHLTLHDEITRVPLIVRVPGGVAGKRAHGLVGLKDVAPTLLELAGITKKLMQGVSLVPVLREWSVEHEDAVVSVSLRDAAIRDGDLKYIDRGLEKTRRGPAPELYRLSDDPHERDDRIAWDTQNAAALLQELDRRRAASAALRTLLLGRDASGEKVALPAEEREKLRALGYLAEPDRAPTAEQ